MATYNEDVRAFIAARYEELGHASRHMRTLHDARIHGKFTRHHTTTVSETIAAHLNEHFSADPDLPDLGEWDGFNTPQRVYQAAGGDGLVFWANQSSGVITSVTMDSTGSGYTRPPVLSLALAEGEPGSGVELRPIMGEVTGCSITNEGDDYTSAPTVTISNPDDADGTQATMAVYRGKVNTVSLNTGGSSYDADATVTIGAPDQGSDNATADITVVSGAITDITLTHPGSGYTSNVSVSVNSNAGSGATFGTSIDDSVIAGCYIIDKGAGYTTTPTATMSGGGGSGATFGVTFRDDIVKDIEIVAGGSGYSTDPYPTETVTLALPAAPASTEAQTEDDNYIPDGWSATSQTPNDTDQREVYRSERHGRLSLWDEWEDPTLYAEYSV